MTTPPVACKPDLASVLVRIERAKAHLSDFDSRAKTLVAACQNAVVREHDEHTSEYVLRLGQIPAIPPLLSAIIGDAIHNLRVSLDYLACQLVIATGGKPNWQTYFPVLKKHPTAKDGSKVDPDIKPGVPQTVRRLLDEIQPYKRAKPANHELAVLHQLDINDKHHELLIAIYDVRSIGWLGDLDIKSIEPGPYESGSEICRFTYPGFVYPPNTPGPINFTATPKLEFCLSDPGAGAWGRTIGASDLVSLLLKYIEGEVLPHFKGFF